MSYYVDHWLGLNGQKYYYIDCWRRWADIETNQRSHTWELPCQYQLPASKLDVVIDSVTTNIAALQKLIIGMSMEESRKFIMKNVVEA